MVFWSMRRVAFATFGCRLNQYDTEALRSLLERQGGWRTVGSREDADIYVVNTCSVTARADAAARKAIRRIHDEHPDAGIVVTGCYAQRAPQEIESLPGVNLIVGAADRGSFARHLERIRPGALITAVSPISAATKFLDVPISEMLEHSRAYVKIQEGCNESCTFCIVPQTRGRSRSRRVESVIEQVGELVSNGYVEIVLTGVHIGDYGADLPGGRRRLVEVLEKILTVPGLKRFRLSSIEPASIAPALIELMVGEPRFARHFHIPFQSGSDAILERMKRRYSAGDFKRLIGSIATRIPDCGIGTDVICGFPGESDAHFQETFDCLESLPITYLHPFSYSARPGSAAEGYDNQIPGDIKKRRVRALKRLSRDKNLAFRAAHVGRRMPVLLESARRPGAARGGWTDNYLRVWVGEASSVDEIVDVDILAANEDGLVGKIRCGQPPGSPASRLS